MRCSGSYDAFAAPLMLYPPRGTCPESSAALRDRSSAAPCRYSVPFDAEDPNRLNSEGVLSPSVLTRFDGRGEVSGPRLCFAGQVLRSVELERGAPDVEATGLGKERLKADASPGGRCTAGGTCATGFWDDDATGGPFFSSDPVDGALTCAAKDCSKQRRDVGHRRKKRKAAHCEP